MLLELHVRNLALIERADVEFGDGLEILTGETGAGKSIIIGSVSLALGQKAPREIIRSGAEYAYVELVFSVTEEKRAALETMDVFPDEDGLLIISRKLLPARSVSKINDETVTAAKLRQVTGLLIDIHGQHEHQSLLHGSKHLEILDAYGKAEILPVKEKIESCYRRYRLLQEQLEEMNSDEESRRRETDFLQFEVDEIENAALKEGEEELLAEQYRRFSNGRRILESLSSAYNAVETEGLGQAIRQLGQVVAFDEALKAIEDQLYDAESILSDARHAIAAYMEEVSFDEEQLAETEKRLDLIHNLQAKYGNTIEQIFVSLEEKKTRLDQLANFDEYRRETQREYEKAQEQLEIFCGQLSELRRKAAVSLTARIRDGLIDLNFLDVQFEIHCEPLGHYTENGQDSIEFMISTNPGETVKPLGKVASGGELSRIMLAVKSVLADADAIETLIFDEIDTGISGRTAQKVSEKMAVIARNHQVICITHLPQIAAMADDHYVIEKSAMEQRTITEIHHLSDDASVGEIARLLGGVEITDAVMQNAREMKNLAQSKK